MASRTLYKGFTLKINHFPAKVVRANIPGNTFVINLIHGNTDKCSLKQLRKDIFESIYTSKFSGVTTAAMEHDRNPVSLFACVRSTKPSTNLLHQVLLYFPRNLRKPQSCPSILSRIEKLLEVKRPLCVSRLVARSCTFFLLF